MVALLTLTAITGCASTRLAQVGNGGGTDNRNVNQSEGGSQTVSNDEEDDSVLGHYHQHLDANDLMGTVTSLVMMYGDIDSLWEDNTLILYDNGDTSNRTGNLPYVDGSSQRYELVKEMYISSRGIHHWGAFYGSFTCDGDVITLNSPDWASYVLFYGDGYEHYNYTEEGGVVDPNSPALGTFYGPIMDYHFNTGTQAQQVQINKEDGSFEFLMDTSDDVETETSAGDGASAEDTAEEPAESEEAAE